MCVVQKIRQYEHSNAMKQQQLFNNYFLFIVVQNDVRFCCKVLTGDINPIWLGQMFRVKSKDIKGNITGLSRTVWIGKCCGWFDDNHFQWTLQLVRCNLSNLKDIPFLQFIYVITGQLQCITEIMTARMPKKKIYMGRGNSLACIKEGE